MAATSKEAAAAAVDDGKLNRLVAAQLQKTKMCAMHQRGTCRDPKCRFAHSADELRIAPNLTKTAICRMFTRGQCRKTDCKFAHGEQELRVTESVYKTQLCNFHMRGHCKKGSNCRHAHGEEQLRSFLAAEKASRSQPPRAPTPTTSDDTQSTATGDQLPLSDRSDVSFPCSPEAADMPDLRSLVSPQARWSPMTQQDWLAAYFAAGGANPGPRICTPPPVLPTSLPYPTVDPQLTPEKVPQFPGAPRSSPARPATPEFAEPMKVTLPGAPSFAAPSPLKIPGLMRAVPTPLGMGLPTPLQTFEAVESMSRSAAAQEEMRQLAAAQVAWATVTQEAQAQMCVDFELAAAQLKVKQLQAKRQMYSAAQLAAKATACGLPLMPGQESHFDSIMQSLTSPALSRCTSPAVDMAPFPMGGSSPVATPPPGLESMCTSNSNGGSPPLVSPEAFRASQPNRFSMEAWHPADLNLKHGTAWVI